MSRFPYQFFDEYVVRTPTLSRKKFFNAINKSEVTSEELHRICSDAVFQEAIRLASPYLYEEMMLWLKSEKRWSPKEFQKFKNALLKYFSRMSTRCTPFGLFSSVGLGKFENENTEIESGIKKIRDTRLDMHFLVSLSQYLAHQPDIKNKLLYFPNNSIYKTGSRFRYIEYESVDGKRDYIISSVLLSDELECILNYSRKGKTITSIAENLAHDELAVEEAEEFVEELIDNQILVSELEPNVSGNDFLEIIINVLDRIKSDKEVNILRSVQAKVKELDENIGNPDSGYKEIEKLIKDSFDIDYEQKFLFQTDLYSTEKKKLSNTWQKELKKGISFLNKITLPHNETHFEKFKKAFYNRFETEEVPLAYALDMEIGIGYRQDVNSKGMHPYLDDLRFLSNGKNQDIKIQLNAVQRIFNEKLQDALTGHQDKIELSDEDFKDFEENWKDLPATISCTAEIISEDHQKKLVLNGGGGSSAANLLGRFCSEKAEVHHLTRKIAEKEEELNTGYIIAEIIHLPEARIGNVIRRPTLRAFEIPFLAQSLLPEENQIVLEDLYISLKNDRIVLRSGKHNKEILPYLTNAHNYSADSLPVYHFLCDVYSQNFRTGIYFSWGDLTRLYHFLPRVEYRNIILSKAQWNITEKEIKQLLLKVEDRENFLKEIHYWRVKRKIPQWIQWVQFDNKLTVNLENYDWIRMFLDSVKNRKEVIIEEFLYDEHEDFCHEYIFPMYKEQ